MINPDIKVTNGVARCAQCGSEVIGGQEHVCAQTYEELARSYLNLRRDVDSAIEHLQWTDYGEIAKEGPALLPQAVEGLVCEYILALKERDQAERGRDESQQWSKAWKRSAKRYRAQYWRTAVERMRYAVEKLFAEMDLEIARQSRARLVRFVRATARRPVIIITTKEDDDVEAHA